MPVKKTPLKERFWSKVVKGGPDDCWIWTGAKANFGYGVIGRGGRGEGNARAHVLSWEWANNQKMPKGMVVRHICDNPSCVNPKHLIIGTQKQNVHDAVLRNRGHGKGSVKGEDHYNAKLTTKDIETIFKIRNKTTWSYRKIAEKFNVSKTTIRNIVTKQSWRHIHATA